MRAGTSTSLLPLEVESLVRSTVTRIRASGGSVIGLIGFSQGTKVVAGLLRASEILSSRSLSQPEHDWCDFKFGISVCSSYPPPLLPASICEGLGEEEKVKKIETPTFHVLGTQDEWMWAGRGLVDGYYEVGEGRAEVVEWDMGHHYPTRPEESERIGAWMMGVMERIEGEGRESRK